MRDVGGGDGNRETDIDFTNTGASTCVLSGTPGVSVVGDGNGTQLGKPAARTGGNEGQIRIKPGSMAVAQLERIYIDALTTTFTKAGGGTVPCKVQQGNGYRIYPPHSFKAAFVKRANTYACTTSTVWMHISSVRTPQ